VKDEEASNAHRPVCKTVNEALPANSIYCASKRDHLEALLPIFVFKHDGIIRTASTALDRTHSAFEGDDVTYILAVILQADDVYVGISTTLTAPTRNANQLCMKT
jgi:hypothetical protein